jgi:hypothetical protein
MDGPFNFQRYVFYIYSLRHGNGYLDEQLWIVRGLTYLHLPFTKFCHTSLAKKHIERHQIKMPIDVIIIMIVEPQGRFISPSKDNLKSK